jgi:hypothetical protein
MLRIVGLPPSLYHNEIAGFHDVFEVFASVSEAMGEYGYTLNEQHVNRCAI